MDLRDLRDLRRRREEERFWSGVVEEEEGARRGRVLEGEELVR